MKRGRTNSMAPTLRPDVLVIGGGLLGWSVAYRLGRAGIRTNVVDRGDEGYATQAGAGIIAPGASFRSTPAFFPLAAASMRYYPRLLGELKSDGAGDTGYRTVGALFIARDEDEAEQLPGVRAIIEQRRESGMGNIGEVAMLTGAEAKGLFPPLAELPAAIHLSGAARVDGRLLRSALLLGAMQHGVQQLEGSATLQVDGTRARVVLNGDQLDAQAIVIAGGAWSNALAEQCHLTIPVYPQRGQILHLAMPGMDTTNWPIIEGFYTQYIVTFGPNRVVCGATREDDSGYELRLTAGGVHEVLTEALRSAPGLATATIAEFRIGLRPFSPDLLPLLGPAPGLDNVFFCTGHGASGLTLGPWSGAAVAGMIQGETPEIDMTPYSPARFQ
jgi:glycine/D-amino acid oxidase-like deaminating enzyme